MLLLSYLVVFNYFRLSDSSVCIIPPYYGQDSAASFEKSDPITIWMYFAEAYIADFLYEWLAFDLVYESLLLRACYLQGKSMLWLYIIFPYSL